MKLSERLLEIFDAKVAIDRETIVKQVSDLDALGEILATAHYDGLDIGPEHIHTREGSILLTCDKEEEALAWLLRNDFSTQQTTISEVYVHHRLAHPRLTFLVVSLTPNGSGARP